MIETRNYYTLGQLAEVMDVEVDLEKDILVNNRPADFQTLVYENFEVEWSVLGYASAPVPKAQPRQPEEERTDFGGSEEIQTDVLNTKEADGTSEASVTVSEPDVEEKMEHGSAIVVIVNGRPVQLDKKESYVFVDVFDYIDFDLSQSRGRGIVTKVNGVDAQFTQNLRDGDRIDIYWKEN